MTIIVESGATKSDWCAVERNGEPVNVRTEGINLSTMPAKAVREIVEAAVSAFEIQIPGFGAAGTVDAVHFYAAGLIAREGERVPESALVLDGVFRALFPDAVLEYASDLLAAARAVCGRKHGIAAILGTGSNSCFYDGEKIVQNVRSAGFILGDEGGGARLGKLFMSDFLKGLVPEPIASEFAGDFPVDYLTVVKNVYRGEAPSKYLGSFAPWIVERYDSSKYVRGLVDGNFRDFIERALKQYPIDAHPVGVVGGFGYALREILRRVAEPYDIKFSKIIAAPMEGLVEYHAND